MVLRMEPQEDPEIRKEVFKRSIELANKAVITNLMDSESWYVLGNAFLTNFFQNNGDPEQLNQALKAYAQTEKLQKSPNPDLCFNRASIFEYLERYNEAVRNYL